jgi:hypothetical protein
MGAASAFIRLSAANPLTRRMAMRGRKSLALIAAPLCFLLLAGLALASGSYSIN